MAASGGRRSTETDRSQPGRKSTEDQLAELAPELVSFLEHHCADPLLAADIAQDALAKAFTVAGSLREMRAMRAWVFRIAINLFNDHLRRVRRRPQVAELMEMPDRDPSAGPDRVLMKSELDSVLRAAVRKLPDRQRTVFMLHGVRGLSHPEIAAVLGITTDAVKTSLFHAREKLRTQLARYLECERS